MTGNTRIYLDYNASAPLLPEAREAMIAALDLVGNPSSVHREGREARHVLEIARADVAAMIGARPVDIVFCSGGTESVAMAIRGAPVASILHSAVEHDAVRAAAEQTGLAVESLAVDAEGRLDLIALSEALERAPKPALVSLMFANNETGVLQPVAEAASLARAHDALVHCDAVQAPGRVALSVKDLDVDFLSLSAHKIGGPKGAGALWLRPGRMLAPLIAGGGQESFRRSGTEAVAAIAGFGAAARCVPETLADMARVVALRDRIEAECRAHRPDVFIAGAGASRLPNVTALSMPGIAAETQVMRFDLEGIAISAGSACSSGKVRQSHVLSAMGIGKEQAGEIVRISLGRGTTEREIARFIAVWKHVCARSRGREKAA
ncbi:MAG: cysteine desulfurase family protein [Rhodothalassiaceae bacterium]